MKQLAALIAAIAMVAGAWAIRDLIDGDDSGVANGDRSADTSKPVRLTCATELAVVCNEVAAGRDDLELSIEEPGATSDRLVELAAGEDPGLDAWLVDAPWAAITADNRRFAKVPGDVLGPPSEVLGRSPAVLAIADDAQGLFPTDCDSTVSWTCMGQAGPALRIGMSSPERGDGLAVLAGAAAEYLDTSDYSANDFERPGFTTWFDRVTGLSARTRTGGQSALRTALAVQGQFNVVGALESQSTELLRDREGWATTYPLPVVTADVTLVPVAGADSADMLGRVGAGSLATALVAAGWRVDGSVPEGGDGDLDLPPTSGLPEPGVLQRLREMW